MQRQHPLETTLEAMIQERNIKASIELIVGIKTYENPSLDIHLHPSLYAIHNQENFLGLALDHNLPDVFFALVDSKSFLISSYCKEIIFGVDAKGQTLFSKAAQLGNIKVLEKVYECTLSVYKYLSDEEKIAYSKIWLKPDNKGNTPLHYVVNVASTDQLSSVKFFTNLIKKEDNAKELINFKNNDGNTPLHFSVTAHLPEVVELITGAGGDFTLENNKHQSPFTLLLSAPIEKQLKMQRLLAGINHSTNNIYEVLINLYRNYLYDFPTDEEIKEVYFSYLKLHSLTALIIGNLEFNTNKIKDKETGKDKEWPYVTFDDAGDEPKNYEFYTEKEFAHIYNPNLDRVSNPNGIGFELEQEAVHALKTTKMDSAQKHTTYMQVVMEHVTDERRLNNIFCGFFNKEYSRIQKLIEGDKEVVRGLITDINARIEELKKLPSCSLGGLILPTLTCAGYLAGMIYGAYHYSTEPMGYYVSTGNHSYPRAYPLGHNATINASHFDCDFTGSRKEAAFYHNSSMTFTNQSGSLQQICTDCCRLDSNQNAGELVGIILGGVFGIPLVPIITWGMVSCNIYSMSLLKSSKWEDLLPRIEDIIEKVQSTPNVFSATIEEKIQQLSDTISKLENKHKKQTVIAIFNDVKNILDDILTEMNHTKRPFGLISQEEISYLNTSDTRESISEKDLSDIDETTIVDLEDDQNFIGMKDEQDDAFSGVLIEEGEGYQLVPIKPKKIEEKASQPKKEKAGSFFPRQSHQQNNLASQALKNNLALQQLSNASDTESSSSFLSSSSDDSSSYSSSSSSEEGVVRIKLNG